MIELVALLVVVGAGAFLLALGGTALLAPPHARAFLLAFAGSPAKHYTELAIRFLVGAAFVLSAPLVYFSAGFRVFGWVVLGTTVALLLVPWRWHYRFAQQAVPQALQFLPLVGVSSAMFGAFILWAVWRAHAA